MSTSLLYHGFALVGYHYCSQDFQEGQVIFRIDRPRKHWRCSSCGSQDVWSQGRADRTFRTLPIGTSRCCSSSRYPASCASTAARCVRSSSASPTPRNITPEPSSVTSWTRQTGLLSMGLQGYANSRVLKRHPRKPRHFAGRKTRPAPRPVG